MDLLTHPRIIKGHIFQIYYFNPWLLLFTIPFLHLCSFLSNSETFIVERPALTRCCHTYLNRILSLKVKYNIIQSINKSFLAVSQNENIIEIEYDKYFKFFLFRT